MLLSVRSPWARICRNTCSQPVPLCFIAAIWSSVSGFGPFALPAEGAADGDGLVVLLAPFVVVVGGGAICASADAAPNNRRIAATCDASPISGLLGRARGQYRLEAAGKDTCGH